MFKNSVSKLSVDPNGKKCVCKCTMANSFLATRLFDERIADLGLRNLLTEYFGSNERNFSTHGDGFLAW